MMDQLPIQEETTRKERSEKAGKASGQNKAYGPAQIPFCSSFQAFDGPHAPQDDPCPYTIGRTVPDPPFPAQQGVPYARLSPPAHIKTDASSPDSPFLKDDSGSD